MSYKDHLNKTNPLPSEKGKKESKSIKDYTKVLFDLDLEEPMGRIKFLLIFFLIGLGFIFLGDILRMIHFGFSGSGCIAIGWTIISLGVIIPFASWMGDEK